MALGEGSEDSALTGRVLVNPVEMKPNPAVPQKLWEKFASLPSQTRPQRAAKPAIRLTALAHELASDGLLDAAGQKAHAAMHKFLDQFVADRKVEFDKKRASIKTVEGKTIIADLRKGTTETAGFTEDADDMVIGRCVQADGANHQPRHRPHLHDGCRTVETGSRRRFGRSFI